MLRCGQRCGIFTADDDVSLNVVKSELLLQLLFDTDNVFSEEDLFGDDGDDGDIDETAVNFWLRRLNNVVAGGKTVADDVTLQVSWCELLSNIGRTFVGRFWHIQRNLSHSEHKSFSNFMNIILWPKIDLSKIFYVCIRNRPT